MRHQHNLLAAHESDGRGDDLTGFQQEQHCRTVLIELKAAMYVAYTRVLNRRRALGTALTLICRIAE